MFIINLIRVDYFNGSEVRTSKAMFVSETTDDCLVPLREYFDEKERRVRTYLADNCRIYPVFEIETTQSEQVVLVNTPVIEEVQHV